MRSMTGFAHVDRTSAERDISVEVRSVNNRYLEVYPSVPSFLNPLEPDIKRLVSHHAHRGKVEVQVRVREYQSDLTVHVNRSAVDAARKALDEIKTYAGLGAEPTYADILAFEGVMQTERVRDPDDYREDILDALSEALEAWNRTRGTEGAATQTDIMKHVDRVRAAVTVFADAAPRVEQLITESVRTRFQQVLGDEAEEQRIYAEAAALIIKHATNEEISRLQSHLESFSTLATSTGPVGKRLDFICQEMNREINTTGSKTVLPEVQDAVVDAKDAVEAIREQVRNIE